MQVELDREQEDLIERAIAAGRLRRPEDAVREALALWLERERRRDEILAAIDAAEQGIAAGESLRITDAALQERKDDVKRRGHARPLLEFLDCSARAATLE